ncbi:hypothetical protein ID866_9437 [Astraeus odoratus]|nr:hypothetical protein ID866_9437 [Astraeus odoratus]
MHLICPVMYQLTNHVVHQQVNHYRQAAKDECKGCEGILQTDRWTRVNFHHLDNCEV